MVEPSYDIEIKVDEGHKVTTVSGVAPKFGSVMEVIGNMEGALEPGDEVLEIQVERV